MMRGRRGFTLIEVMMTMVVFAGAMAAFFSLYISTSRLTESSRNLTQAMNDGRIVMEAMRDTAQTGGLTGAGGVTGVYPAANNLAAAFGLASLQNEAIRATYTNAAADPLSVTLQISWDEWGRTRTVSLDTMVTRR